MKKKAAEKIDEDWMSTYGDMVTLLLCFFVMMLAASTPDAAKYEQIQPALTKVSANRKTSLVRLK